MPKECKDVADNTKSGITTGTVAAVTHDLVTSAKDYTNVINDVLDDEGGSAVTNDPADRGGRTQYGISERSHPEAWKDDKVTEQEAREIYLKKYVVGPGFHTLPVSHAKLQAQLIDFGVNSGPAIAIQKLREILEVKVDGLFGPKTLQATVQRDPRELNNLLAQSRTEMICKLVQKTPSQIKFLLGWVRRALSFQY